MIYLDNAATSWPKPPEVIRAVSGVMEKLMGNPGRAGHAGALAGARVIENCRSAVAALVGCRRPERIIFCLNCTDAVNIALKGFLRRGDEVLVSHAEHNAVMRPLTGLASRGEITIKTLTPGENGLLSPDAIKNAVTPKTALCVLCHAGNVTGILQPARAVADACHHFGVPLLLDAAQTAGTEDLSLTDADMIAMPGHKGLLGPMGTGVLYVGEGVALRPLREGGTGSLSESMAQPTMLPDALESGTSNLPGIAGLLQGVKFVTRHREAIREYESVLTGRLLDGLAAMKDVSVLGGYDAPRVGVVSFTLRDRDSGEIADRLNQMNIAVRGGLHCAPSIHAYLHSSGAVRASVGPYSTESDIDSLLEALKTI